MILHQNANPSPGFELKQNVESSDSGFTSSSRLPSHRLPCLRRNSSPNDTRQLLGPNAEHHPNGVAYNPNQESAEAGDDPELRTNVLFLTRSPSPVALPRFVGWVWAIAFAGKAAGA